MKKFIRFSFIGALALISFPVFSQQLIQGFNGSFFPPAGWQSVHVLGSNSWSTSSEFPWTGTGEAVVNPELINGANGGQGDNWLISPKVYNIQSSDNLSFYYASIFNDLISAPYFENLEIYVSTTDNNISSFTLLNSISLASPSVLYQNKTISLASYAGQNIYIAFRDVQNQGNGIYLDDVTAGSPLTIDAGSLNTNIGNSVIATGSPFNISDTIKNFGTGNLPSGIPVSYTVNGGAPVTVSTTSAIAPGNTTIVDFNGANAFTPNVPGKYIVKVFTDYSSEVNRGNDTLAYEIEVQTPIIGFPYFQDFENQGDWASTGNMDFQIVSVNADNGVNPQVINPDGNNNKTAFANTYQSAGDSIILRSPLFNFSNISGSNKPLLHFYVAAGLGHNSPNDWLRVLVSTDGGVTFSPAPVYSKSNSTSSKLVTIDPDPNFSYVPQLATDWRHEIVDLSAYAGNPNIMLAFKVSTNLGNNVWIDNVSITSQPIPLYGAAMVTAAGQTITGPFNSQVKFNTLPVADSIRMEGHSDYPTNNTYDFSTNATFPDGSTITSLEQNPFPQYYTIAYSGNSIIRANYNISLDISGITGYNITDLNKICIVKRPDFEGKWIPLNTTRAGNVYTAANLDNFSEFALAYSPDAAVPVTLTSLNAIPRGNKVVIQWSTSQEANIVEYDVQRWDEKNWITLGSVTSQRSSMQNQYSFDDNNPQPGMNLYRLKIVSEIGSFTYSDVVKAMFESLVNRVYQNVPNPVISQTKIRVDLGKASKLSVVVYSLSGKQIAVLENSNKPAGTYQIEWIPGNIPAGTYYYKVIIDGQVQTKTMIKLP